MEIVQRKLDGMSQPTLEETRHTIASQEKMPSHALDFEQSVENCMNDQSAAPSLSRLVERSSLAVAVSCLPLWSLLAVGLSGLEWPCRM